MGMFGPGKEGWLAEAEMLSWAFRHLKAEERDYLTKRLKHVLGKRTLKGSWFENLQVVKRSLKAQKRSRHFS